MQISLAGSGLSLMCLGNPRAKVWDGQAVLDKATGEPLYLYPVSIADGERSITADLQVPYLLEVGVHARLNAVGLVLDFAEYTEQATGKTRKTWKLVAEGLEVAS